MSLDKKLLEELGEQLTHALGGYSNIEKMLILAKIFREEAGGEWVINADEDGGFSIERRYRP